MRNRDEWIEYLDKGDDVIAAGIVADEILREREEAVKAERERCAKIAGEAVLPFGSAVDYPRVIMQRILEIATPPASRSRSTGRIQ